MARVVMDVTPESVACPPFMSCPKIFKIEGGGYYIVGKKGRHLPQEVADSIGHDEDAVEVPTELIDGLKK